MDKTKVNKIVDYLIKYGTSTTLYGSYCFSFSELEDMFKISIRENLTELIDELADREEVADYEYDGEEISIYFFINFCKNLAN